MEIERDIFTILRGQRGVGANDSYLGKDPRNQGDIFCEMPKPDHRTLEIGFGQGEAICALLDAGVKDVWGVDAGLASHINIYAEGRKTNPHALTPEHAARAKLLYFDVCNQRFPWPNDWFDYCFMTETIEHLDNPYHTVMEIKRVLKHRGILVVSYPRWEDTFGKDQYAGGVHAYVYPGLFGRDTAARFFMQCYFKHLKYVENGATAFAKLENHKERTDGKTFNSDAVSLPDVFTVVAGNFTEEDLYGFLKK